MKSPRLPFIEYNGRAFMVLNFDLPPTDDMPPLPELFAELITHQNPADILILRPLNRAETKILRQCQQDSEVEAWAQMVIKNKDRFRGRENK